LRPNPIKRFWREARTASRPEGWAVELDGRPLRTPAGAAFLAPTRALGEAAAAEWDAQGERPDPRAMPLTRAVNTAIDRVTPHRAAVVAEIAAYAGTDLLCYRAPHPPELSRRQAEAWDPVLDWAEGRWRIKLLRVEGVMHAPQPAPAVAALSGAVEGFDAFGLTALHDLATLSGSVILALATAEGELSPDDAWTRSRLDEAWQIERWGEDAEAAEAAAARREAFLAAARLLDLLAPETP
jgi:chaperone required for assembly of F1-ATPase